MFKYPKKMFNEIHISSFGLFSWTLGTCWSTSSNRGQPVRFDGLPHRYYTVTVYFRGSDWLFLRFRFWFLIFDLIKIRSNVLKEGYRVQNLFCDNNLWFRDFVITRNQVASHLVVIFWYVHVIYNFEYSSRDVFTVMFKLVPTVLVILSSIESQRIPV